VFCIIVLLHDPAVLQLQLRQVPSIKASRPGPEAAKHPQTITPPPPCLTAVWSVYLTEEKQK
jgi:hypothetical protein